MSYNKQTGPTTNDGLALLLSSYSVCFNVFQLQLQSAAVARLFADLFQVATDCSMVVELLEYEQVGSEPQEMLLLSAKCAPRPNEASQR